MQSRHHGGRNSLKNYEQDEKTNHQLTELYISFPDLMSNLDILEILEVKNGFMWEYRIQLQSNELITLKDIEAVRYGSFAKNRDILTIASESKQIIKLLEKLGDYVQQKRTETNNLLQECF